MRIFSLISIIFGLIVSGCSPVPPGQLPDDVVITPGGPAYRANTSQQGVHSVWSPIAASDLILPGNLTVTYRATVMSSAGEVRNNLILVRMAGENDYRPLSIQISNVSRGIKVRLGDSGQGLPGTSWQVIIIEIPYTTLPGNYPFYFNVIFDGFDYGTVQCNVKVVQA